MSQKLDEEFKKELDEQIDFLKDFDEYRSKKLIGLKENLQKGIDKSRLIEIT